MNQELMSKVVNNLYLFYRAFVANNFERNVHAPHIQALADELTKLTFKEDYKNRLCVNMPPQHSKSSLITVAYTIWLILQNPKTRILVINAEGTLSETFGLQIRDIINKIGPLFGVTLSNVKSSSTHLMFEKNGQLQTGYIRLVGASGSITGSPVDVLIIDDPYKGFDDITPTLLQKKINWFKRIVEQRLREDSKLLILHTRWHSDDLTGYIRTNTPEDYNFISFPAIDKEGNRLWPQYYSHEFYMKKLEVMGEREFQALYQQEPIDSTGNFFNLNNVIWEDNFNNYLIAKCRSWDIASSDDKLGDRRDYSTGARMGKVNDNEYWIFPFERGQYGNAVKNQILRTAKLDTVSYPILLEPGTVGGASGLLFEEYKSFLKGYNVTQSLPIGTKADRATPLANAMYDGKIHVYIKDEDLRQDFIDEFKAFPNGKHDDIVDAYAYAFNYLKNRVTQNIVSTASKRKRRRII